MPAIRILKRQTNQIFCHASCEGKEVVCACLSVGRLLFHWGCCWTGLHEDILARLEDRIVLNSPSSSPVLPTVPDTGSPKSQAFFLWAHFLSRNVRDLPRDLPPAHKVLYHWAIGSAGYPEKLNSHCAVQHEVSLNQEYKNIWSWIKGYNVGSGLVFHHVESMSWVIWVV